MLIIRMQSNQNADKAGDFANKEFKQKEGESHIPDGHWNPAHKPWRLRSTRCSLDHPMFH